MGSSQEATRSLNTTASAAVDTDFHADRALTPLFSPRSVAVVGASDDATKVGGRVLAYLASGRFKGSVIAVNPKRSMVMGIPAAPSLSALTAPVDAAIVALPPQACVDVVAQCAVAGVGVAIVLTSGFAEVGVEGAARQAALLDAITGTSTRLLGPNCLGVVNERVGYVGTFATMWAEPWLAPGGVAIVSQSGATASYLFVLLRERGVGISAWVATGNEADIDAAACVEHLVEDDATRAIIVALEGIRDGAGLVRAFASARASGKAVIVIKAGRSDVAVEAVRSHTAALAGDDRVFDAAMQECGAVRCASYTDAVDIAAACVSVQPVTGNRVAIVSASGGAGILMADRADECGLEVPALSSAVRSEIDAMVPGASSRNPVDVTAMVLNDLGLLAKPIARLRACGEVDLVVAFLTSAFRADEAVTRVIDALRSPAPGWAPLLLSAYTSTENLRRLFEARLPTYVDPARAIEVAAALHRLSALHPRGLHQGEDEPAVEPPASLDEASLLSFFGAHGVSCVAAQQVTSREAASAAASHFGFPVAVKVSIPGLAHKADIGGVYRNISDAQAVADAFDAVAALANRHAPSGSIASAIVQPMVRGHREMMIGFRRDASFGAIVALGFGGAWVEVIGDVVLRLAPFDVEKAHAMIDSLRGRALLDGTRGQPAADVDALAQSLAAFSRLVARLAGAASAELNPVIMGKPGEGVVAVDAKMVLAS